MDKKTKMIVSIIAFALFIAVAVFAYNKLSKKVSPQEDIKITQDEGEVSNNEEEPEKFKAPDFTVLDWEGNEVKLSDFIGKPIVLNFWASWCPPCKSEMPEFNAVYKEMRNDVTFMMVDLVDGQRETKDRGSQYIKDAGFSFPVYFDMTQDAAVKYGIRSIPTTVFIDKEGYIITGAQGAIDTKKLLWGIDLIK